jgi:SpoVK/Ycf46/Vps4 family AAA+-type ATPase
VLDEKLMQLMVTRQTMDSLILPAATKEILRTIVTKSADPVKNNLQLWGLGESSPEGQPDTKDSMIILLYGLPGTGKTYTAGAIANTLGRPLISINAANLRSKWYGETQQIIKKLFKKMRKIVADTFPASPVFLLNEADQLIHTRQDISYASATEVENAIQNIILEELETFPGIFVATTNLVENLDIAFSRRFHYKIELPSPDAECRKQLWMLNLHPNIPGIQQIDFAWLAANYPLSGGQIRLIIQNACSEAIIREEHERYLTMSDLTKYIHLETGSSFENRTKTTQEKKQIGFGVR